MEQRFSYPGQYDTMRPPPHDNDIPMPVERARLGIARQKRKSVVLSEWLQLQWVILPVLAIPLAILLGMRWTNGAILVTSIAALLADVFAWYRTVTDLTGYRYGAAGVATADSIVAQVGGVLLLTTWILAQAHAVQSRRWVWFALIIVAGFLSYSTSFLSGFALNPCGFLPPDGASFPACQPPDQILFLLIELGEALGPVAALLYALLAARGPRRQRQLPEGLVVSSLRDGRDGLAVDEGATPAD